MTKLEQAARQALEALEVSTDWDVGARGKQLQSMKAITALREALSEQAEQEPVDKRFASGSVLVPNNIALGIVGSSGHARKRNVDALHEILNAAPIEPVKQGPVMDYERLNALREGEQNGAEDAYFFVRPENDTPTLRKMFCQGFERGFHKGLKYTSHAHTKDLTDDEIAALFQFDDYDFARAVIAADRKLNGVGK